MAQVKKASDVEERGIDGAKCSASKKGQEAATTGMLRARVTMKATLISLALLLLAAFLPAQTTMKNAELCVSGKFPALCNHALLTPSQEAQARAAERRENLATCLTGTLAAICRHDLLTPDQLPSVRRAERAENLKTCLTGTFAAICNHGLLGPDEAAKVQKAERAENLKTCLAGTFAAVCNHAWLSPAEAVRVAVAERSKPAPRARAAKPRAGYRARSGCEAGHWIESVTSDGSIVKLDDGGLWEVDSIDRIYSALWLPMTEIVACDGKLMNTDDNEIVNATPLTSAARPEAHGSEGVIESAIDGEFNGWDGETIFKLTNGQIWQQAEYAYSYAYAYGPAVTIFSTSGGYRMKVEDENETILVRRIK